MFIVDPTANVDRTHRVGKILLPPAFLVRHFGPHNGGDGLRSTGGWSFSAESGEVYTLYEYRQTRTSLGFFSGAPPARRFWSQREPAVFHIGGQDDSNVEGFKTWLNAQYEAFGAA